MQGFEEGYLGEVDGTTTTLLYASLHSSNAIRPLKMLVCDRTSSAFYSGISVAQSTYTTFL